MKTETTTHPSATKEMITQEDKMNVELKKKIMAEKTTGTKIRKRLAGNRKGKQFFNIYLNR